MKSLVLTFIWLIAAAEFASVALPQAPTPAPQQPAVQSTLPTAPARPMLPLSPHDPASLSLLLHVIQEEKKLIQEENRIMQETNEKIKPLNAKIQGFDQIGQDEVQAIKKKEGWGPEVVFNGELERFEKPLPGTESKPASAQPTTTTHNKDTNAKEKP